jgi:hypothetical protein
LVSAFEQLLNPAIIKALLVKDFLAAILLSTAPGKLL